KLFAQGHTDDLLLGKRAVVPGDYVTGALTSAVGFVASASDLASFFSQLSPRAQTSVISAASRRKMTRSRWRSLHSSLNNRYGLGTLIGTVNGWNWFGHSGGLQGYVSRTKMLASHDLTVCVLANSVSTVRWNSGSTGRFIFCEHSVKEGLHLPDCRTGTTDGGACGARSISSRWEPPWWLLIRAWKILFWMPANFG